MSGASDRTQRVAYVNANWAAGQSEGRGSFELSTVTEDGTRYAQPVPDGQMAGLVALTQASSVLLWDPEGETLIAANLVGEWIQTSWSAGDARQANP